ncbi:MAG: hypothetical protein P1S60_03395 [Anaerolineae bacterium]|nr:hypothetical protein [Anaerolineae bacterium]
MEIFGLILGAILTLLIFSYLLKDTILYRWALALLVGCGIGYGLGLAWHQILREWILNTLSSQEVISTGFYAIPLVLGALLLFKGFSPNSILGRISVLGNIPLSYLVGVGTAVALSGALMGTLIPQIISTGDALSLENDILGFIQGGVIVCGTVAALLFFSPSIKKQAEFGEGSRIMKWIRRIGYVFIVITLAVTFSGAITTALTVLILRLWHVSDLVRQLITLGGGI